MKVVQGIRSEGKVADFEGSSLNKTLQIPHGEVALACKEIRFSVSKNRPRPCAYDQSLLVKKSLLLYLIAEMVKNGKILG